MDDSTLESTSPSQSTASTSVDQKAPISEKKFTRRGFLKLATVVGMAVGGAAVSSEIKNRLEYFSRVLLWPQNYVEIGTKPYSPSFIPLSKEVNPLLQNGKAFDIQKSEFVYPEDIDKQILLRSTPLLSTAGMQDTMLLPEYFQDSTFRSFVERVQTSFEQQPDFTHLTGSARKFAFIRHANRIIDNEMSYNSEGTEEAIRNNVPYQERISNNQTRCFEQALYLNSVLAASGYKTDMLYFAWKNPEWTSALLHAVVLGDCDGEAVVADPTGGTTDSFQNYFNRQFENTQLYKEVWVDSISAPHALSPGLAKNGHWLKGTNIEALSQQLQIKSPQQTASRSSATE